MILINKMVSDKMKHLETEVCTKLLNLKLNTTTIKKNELEVSVKLNAITHLHFKLFNPVHGMVVSNAFRI